MRDYAHIDNTKVGDHVTECLYSDRISYTVVKKTAKTIVVQKDFQEIDKDKWKPEIIPGGFAGHCTNQSEQVWKVESNPNGALERFHANKNGFYKTKYSSRRDVILGAHPFYDYNF